MNYKQFNKCVNLIYYVNVETDAWMVLSKAGFSSVQKEAIDNRSHPRSFTVVGWLYMLESREFEGNYV